VPYNLGVTRKVFDILHISKIDENNYIEKNSFIALMQPWGWTVSTLDVGIGEAGRGSRDDLVNQ